MDASSISITRKNIKNLYLRVVPPHGEVQVSAPKRMSDAQIAAFVASREDWIAEQQARLSAVHSVGELAYVDGEVHWLFGQRFRLLIKASSRYSVTVVGDRLLLRCPASASVERRAKAVAVFYRDQLHERVTELLPRWEQRMGVVCTAMSFRKMTSRWGSCTPRKGSIRLNTELAKHAPVCLEYVLVHELTHLLEPSHNARFHALMDAFRPNWRAERELLNRCPPGCTPSAV